jgi:predicted nucleotidyltransferase component of viral defense system
MTKSLLTQQQKKFLDFFNEQILLWDKFYLSGGTALSEFYLRHRFSEDLDFFSEQEIDVAGLNLFLQTKKADFAATSIQFQQSFNRNLFFIQDSGGQEMKAEFTYYPFPRLKEGMTKDHLQIDSVLDIAVNKAFTLMQQARGRDYVDLFAIAQKYGFDFRELLKGARYKFDYPINYLQLGKNLVKAGAFLDDVILREERIDSQEMEAYFLALAKSLNIIDK